MLEKTFVNLPWRTCSKTKTIFLKDPTFPRLSYRQNPTQINSLDAGEDCPELGQ